MEWQVTIDDDVKKINLPDGSTANDLVNHLELHPDGFWWLQMKKNETRPSCGCFIKSQLELF